MYSLQRTDALARQHIPRARDSRCHAHSTTTVRRPSLCVLIGHHLLVALVIIAVVEKTLWI